jgi:hypothetical protein
MIVTWVTFNKTSFSTVEYGTSSWNLNFIQRGSSTLFKDGGSEQRILYIHRVVLTGLIPGETYCEPNYWNFGHEFKSYFNKSVFFVDYHCGSEDVVWSPVYWFTAMKDGTDWSPRFAIYGDLGSVNGVSIPL